ncbi:hypothetical protein METBIDRAFT_98495 [Metschnikowia bicuspidata var. bicuspidata NRRL YB-4993]|uniref:Uncharacterized protein n=1 Tax=Metschnikowia bicuspidata var. bicuspidata NRRL YB-4993 TaxID=869754 RepID=A0A1A0HGG2_9ASCO|nr:hypothetical protein METBIDRAFT_98495 [Metschnikowia bicuspidata var. bicuspidata NRRL YB-4993]OBA23080.1 hypothetical protein METBIDRAFT_98495 [Metschnikowia bicuspidata var. bicuspidata NRRL YB-4993]
MDQALANMQNPLGPVISQDTAMEDAVNLEGSMSKENIPQNMVIYEENTIGKKVQESVNNEVEDLIANNYRTETVKSVDDTVLDVIEESIPPKSQLEVYDSTHDQLAQRNSSLDLITQTGNLQLTPAQSTVY